MILDRCTSGRLLVEADLVPLQGQRFQPTGFADLGAAVYTLPDGTRMLLVESAQSMANRLEQAIVTPDGEIIPELEGLSYVAAELKGKDVGPLSTTTLLEAHRLASPFIIADKAFQKQFCEETAYSKKGVLNWKRIHATIFKYDVNSLLHGVFLSIVDGGRIKVPRLISAFIEARNVREAISGGVKNSFDPTGSLRHAEYDKDVYSNVPYQRTEYTAERITAYFNLDVGGIRALGLPKEAQELLFCLGLYKMRRLLSGSLRLRTACDLRLDGEPRLSGMDSLPTEAELLAALQQAVAACAPLFAQPPVTRLQAPITVKNDKNKDAANDSTDSEEA